MIYSRVVAVCWMVAVVYWIISAMRAKKRLRGNTWRRGWWVRAVLIIGLIELYRFRGFRELVHGFYGSVAAWQPVAGPMGAILCAIGIVFAIWARRTIGRNWGMPMSLQEEHELVTTGPYAWVRHPIYTGILLAMIGTALVDGVGAFLILVIFGVYFTYSATREEKLMLAQFPKQYPEYMARTKRLSPLVW